MLTAEYIKKKGELLLLSNKHLKELTDRNVDCYCYLDVADAQIKIAKLLKELVAKGYLAENEGYRNGDRVVDMDYFINSYKSGNVINEAPRVKHNIVTLELINKICAWVRTTKKVKKLF